jgi:predicted PurR-regulated permease PerM
MNNDTKQSGGARFLFLAAALVIVIAGIRMTSPILVPFFLSAFIAIISN